MQFLFNNTQTYIYIFLEFYFNEVFNAHGQDSTSCSLGMVERLVNVHAQASEIYISMLTKTHDEIDMITDSEFQQMRQFNISDTSQKDDIITDKTWIVEFNYPSYTVDYEHQPFTTSSMHNKYTYHKLNNLLNPKSQLLEKPIENPDEDIQIDYDITPAIRNKWYNDIKVKIMSNKIVDIDGVIEHFVNFVIDYKRKECNVTDDSKFKGLVKERFNKYRDEHLIKVEAEMLKQDLLMMCDNDINKDSLIEYFAGGSLIRVKSLSRDKLYRRGNNITMKKLNLYLYQM